MRVVGSEHHLVYVEDAAHHLDSQRIVNEADPDLAVEVLAGESPTRSTLSVVPAKAGTQVRPAQGLDALLSRA